MANRPVFVAVNRKPFVEIQDTAFLYYSGFALSQSQKSVRSLQECFLHDHPDHIGGVLEISTKSPQPLGVFMSAFNLQYEMSDGKMCSVESVFQAGKCFENGQQYTDILQKYSYEAKKDERLRNSGNVIGFRLEGRDFPIKPTTFFYDWVYINALYQNKKLTDQLDEYTAFTDIAFNPEKSLNCQARSVAVYVGLKKSGLLEQALSSPEEFRKIVYEDEPEKTKPVVRVERNEQISLFDLCL